MAKHVSAVIVHGSNLIKASSPSVHNDVVG